MDTNDVVAKKVGRPLKDGARRCMTNIRMTEDEKKTFLEASRKFGTGVLIGAIFGAISQLNQDLSKTQKQ